MAWEALNNIAAGKDRRVVIVVNDNGRSFFPTIGGLASHLADLRMTRGYEHALDLIKRTVPRAPVVGGMAYEALHGIKKGIKDILQPQAMFEDLGLKYVGPIDGHDEAAVEHALRKAKAFGGPVIVRCMTHKGFGYAPAVAAYATFLIRAFDQLLMDVALHKLPVTVVLDRAGVTGDDGASHNGMWDMSILSVVPGLRLAAPRGEATLREELREAVEVTDGPTVLRYPKGSLPPDLPALERRGGLDVLGRGERPDVLLVAVGSLVPMCLAAAERAADHGIEVTVVVLCWVLV